MTEEIENKKLSGLVPRSEWSLLKGESTLVRRGLDALQRLEKNDSLKQEAANEWVLKGKGIFISVSGSDAEAVSCFDKAIEIDPRCVDAWHLRGLSLDSLGRSAEAIDSIDQALRLEPNNIDIYIDKGLLLEKLGRLEEAILSYDSAIQTTSDKASAWLEKVSAWRLKGKALNDLGRYDDALLSYDKVLEIQELGRSTDLGRGYDYSDVWNYRADTLCRMGRYIESIECCDKAIELSPKYSAPAWDNKGDALMGQYKFQEATVCYDMALRVWPKHPTVWNKKGICLAEIDRFEEALECFEKSIHPEDLGGWYNKARVQEYLGRIQDAIDSYEKYLASPDVVPEVIKRVEERLQGLKSRRS